MVEKEYVKVKGDSVVIDPNRETFTCKNSAGTWSVCDTKTGILIGSGPSREQAASHARTVFRNDHRHIENIGNDARLSPRFKSELAFTYSEFVNDSPKVKWTMDAIREVTAANKEANQIIYMPRGVEYHPLVKEYLVKELGFKDSEVEIVSGLVNSGEEEIEEVKQRFNAGEIKVLIGSEVIKEGMDLQAKTTDLYHLHLPWNPVDLDQVEGRAWRFGNEWAHVRINYPLIEDSVDPFIFQKLETKNKRIQHAKHATENEVDVSDLNFEELKLDLITDPARKKQAEKTMAIHRLSKELNVARAEMAHTEYKLKGREELTKKIQQADSNLQYANMMQRTKIGYSEMAQSAERKKGIYEKKLVELDKRLSGMDPVEVRKTLADMQQKMALKELEVKKIDDKFNKEIETLKKCRPITRVINAERNKGVYEKSLAEIRRENPTYLVKDKLAGHMEMAEPPAKVHNNHLLQKVEGLEDITTKYTSLMDTLTERINKDKTFSQDVKKKIVAALNSEAGAQVIARHNEQAEVVVCVGLCMAEGGATAPDKYPINEGLKDKVKSAFIAKETGESYSIG